MKWGESMVQFENSVWGVVLIGLLLFMIISLFSSTITYKDDPDETSQRKFARDILRGNTTAEDVAKDNNFDPEHVGKWVDDYKKLAIEYALNADKHTHELEIKDQDLKWFEKACEKYIGPDWKEKTDYENRRV